MKNMNTTYADRVSLYTGRDSNDLYMPKELREQREKEKEEEFKKVQDEALSLHQSLYDERMKNGNWIIKPTGTWVIVKPFIDSPYLSPTTASGLVIKRDIKHNSKSGEDETLVREIGVGVVVDCGKDCEEIKPGMDVMFSRGSARVLPISTNEYGEEEWIIIPEGHIIVCGYSSLNGENNDY